MAETLDPLGEVYTGRDNSGSANIIGPRSRQSVADYFVGELKNRAAKKQAIKDAQLKMVDPGNIKSWDRDMPHFQELRNQYSQAAIDYEQKYGQDKAADIVKYNDLLKKKEEMYNSAAASEAHRSIYEHYDKQLSEHPENYGDDARKNLEQWADKSFDQRIGNTPEITEKAADYMKSFKELPKPEGKEVAREVQDAKNPGFTRTSKTVEYDKEKDLPIIDAFMLHSPRDAAKAIQDTYAIKSSDPKFMEQYTAQPTPEAQTKFLYHETVDRLADMREAQIKTENNQGLQAIPEHTSKTISLGLGLDDLVKNGTVVKDESFTSKTPQGKPYGTVAPFASSYKSTGVTVITANGRTLDLNSGTQFKDQRQFKFNPGSTKVIPIKEKDGSITYEPYVFGQAVDTKNVPSGTELTVDESGNFKIGDKYVEKQNVMDVAVPLDKAKNFLQQKPNEQPTKWAEEAATRLNSQKSSPAAQTPAASSAEVERKTKDGKIAVYDANTKKFIRWKK